MDDPSALLATLAQSSAAIVAIVGGFLVSRLVQLSSERDGLRRQLARASDELVHVKHLYEGAHAYRLENSQSRFFEWVIDEVVAAEIGKLDLETLVANNVPRGSSIAEMQDYAIKLVERVESAKRSMLPFVEGTDDSSLALDELQERGLSFDATDAAIYEEVSKHAADLLPRRGLGWGVSALRVPSILNTAGQATEMRRLDESIQEEQDLHSRRTILEADIRRIRGEIDRLGQPSGVLPAIVILGLYSALGVLAPVAVMVAEIEPMPAWLAWTLLGLFAIGLLAVLGYIYWYARSLRQSSPDPEPPLDYTS